MDETDGQGSDDLVDAKTAELLVQPRHRGAFVVMGVLLRSGAGPVIMVVIAMAVKMGVEGVRAPSG
jgi:hypothetical protein